MQISHNSIYKIFLFIFLLNSAGILSPSFGLRGEDWEVARSISSNAINRIIMLLSGVFGIIVVFLSDIEKIRILLRDSKALLILLFIALLSIFWSDLPFVSFVRLLQQFFLVVFIYAICIKLKRKDILDVFLYVGILIVFLGVLTLVIPGSWQDIGYRGLHGHKNTAGYLYAISSVVIFYCIKTRGGVSKYLIPIFFVSLILLFITKSKTSGVLAILSICIIHYAFSFSSLKKLKLLFLVWMVCSLCYVFLLIIPENVINSLGVNLTGRLIIWQFAVSEMEGRELLGVGYRAFWGVGEGGISVLYGEDYDGFITQLNQVHNSYMDIWLMLGWVGLSGFVYFVVSSMALVSKTNSLYFSLLVFLTVHSFLESDFFRSNNFLWVTYILIYFSSIIFLRDRNEA